MMDKNYALFMITLVVILIQFGLPIWLASLTKTMSTTRAIFLSTIGTPFFTIITIFMFSTFLSLFMSLLDYERSNTGGGCSGGECGGQIAAGYAIIFIPILIAFWLLVSFVISWAIVVFLRGSPRK